MSSSSQEEVGSQAKKRCWSPPPGWTEKEAEPMGPDLGVEGSGPAPGSLSSRAAQSSLLCGLLRTLPGAAYDWAARCYLGAHGKPRLC